MTSDPLGTNGDVGDQHRNEIWFAIKFIYLVLVLGALWAIPVTLLCVWNLAAGMTVMFLTLPFAVLALDAIVDRITARW